jgi:uncharacterized protein (DUF2267 family)
MNATGSDVFESTIHKTNEWLNEIAVAVGDRQLAYGALRSVLHALRDRLPLEEAVDLGAQLPMLIRGLYYEGWRPGGKPVKLDKAELLQTIRDHFGSPGVDPEMLARAVLRVLARHVSAGEVADVKSVLPHRLRDLWPKERVAS